ncbi:MULTISPECIES: ribonuclease Y [unclassified Pseudofrankia]|uniref:ribonuclease Y n=1 Tax=unclassified Pseudofrankia TaxID=2994372 RepID=UPI0008D9588B|nr:MULTISPECIES: ribonuclease Y [unclassified Pseudofrankia]MDT3443096.1 ribonuclease Y [Pseudofrankia sp. BMG5.37]OHV49953.1 ribonuclease Y [Pseudofrankia sp. BMG5.36]
MVGVLVALVAVVLVAVVTLILVAARLIRAGARPAVEAPRVISASPSTNDGQTAAALLAAQAEAVAKAEAAATEKTEAAAREKAEALARKLAEAERDRAEAARREAQQERDKALAELRGRREELRDWDNRLAQRETRVEERLAALEDQTRRIESRDRELVERDAALARRAKETEELDARRLAALEQASGMTSAEAKSELLTVVEQQSRLEAATLAREIEARAEEEAQDRARRIVTLAIQRVAAEQTAESVVSVLHLPGDEMKGRIIGREGRNIRAFESVTGVNVLIDDTPEAVLLSCFDPVRREVGRITLAALVADGRIHPQRIEEEYERAQREVETRCVRAGEDALVNVGIGDMHPELIVLLGRLRYRTSYGQNVLAHLVESAHLAGVMAAELRLPTAIAKRGTLLHDLGKALTHEVEGSHALVGAEIARRYGEHEDVVHAIEAHHNEVEPRSVEAVLTQAADAISGGRPGARRDSLESYVRRLERIEQIASDRPGVERVFAMQAGREVRVMVVPEEVDDSAAHLLARDVARQIEDELTYPGQIRVTVVRETRAIEIAR